MIIEISLLRDLLIVSYPLLISDDEYMSLCKCIVLSCRVWSIFKGVRSRLILPDRPRIYSIPKREESISQRYSYLVSSVRLHGENVELLIHPLCVQVELIKLSTIPRRFANTAIIL